MHPHPRGTAMAVGDVGGRPAGGIGNFKGHRDGQVSDAVSAHRFW